MAGFCKPSAPTERREAETEGFPQNLYLGTTKGDFTSKVQGKD